MKQVTALTEDMGNVIFRGMLRTFEKVIDGNSNPEEIRDQLAELKKAAAKNSSLTDRQSEAISGRCDHYLNGTFGNTKQPTHYEQGKPSSK